MKDFRHKEKADKKSKDLTNEQLFILQPSKFDQMVTNYSTQ